MNFSTKKRNVLIFIVLVILILVITYITHMLRNNNVMSNKESKLSVNFASFNLEGRAKLYKENKLFVGENNKELENGYYDFKIEIESNMVILTLNKLWYGEPDKDNIQEEYLAKICRQLVKCLNLNIEKEELEYQLYKYIKENYLSVKNGSNGEMLQIATISIFARSISNECAIYIKVE